MARIRTIKPEFWTDEKVVQLPFQARLLFIGMWNFADDDGYLDDEPERLRLQILPADALDAELLVDLLVAAELIERIEVPDGRILRLPNFAKHQKVSHKTPTKFDVSKGKKQQILSAERRQVALKYGCKPGQMHEVSCYYCGAPGSMQWWQLYNGRPSSWVSFSGLEIDHFIPENSGGGAEGKNLVLACRYCNRSKGSKDAISFIHERNQISPDNSRVLWPEGNGRESNSVSNETDGQAVQSDKVVSLQAPSLWAKPLAYLVKASGKSEHQCRQMLGKWRKASSEDMIIEAITQAQIAQAVEPFSFVTKLLSNSRPPPPDPTKLPYGGI